MFRCLTNVQVFSILAVVCCKSALTAPVALDKHEIFQQKMRIIEEESKLRIGGKMYLTDREQVLNSFLMKEKQRLMDESRINRTSYLPAFSFFKSKSFIDSSNIFKIIQAMPKGCALHLHDLAITSLDWVIKNATYRDNVYMYRDEKNFVRLGAFGTPPTDQQWKSVKTERAAAANVEDFDNSLKKSISMLTTDPLVTYPTITLVWDRFNLYFSQRCMEETLLATVETLVTRLFKFAKEKFRLLENKEIVKPENISSPFQKTEVYIA